MSDYKYIVKADEINGGFEGFEIDEETKAGYECNGFVLCAMQEDRKVINHVHVNLGQLVDWIRQDEQMMQAARMAILFNAVSECKAASNPVNIETLFGVD